jgi:hypothetical protein
MKPTPQISSKRQVHRDFPLTDYSLHPTVGLGTAASSLTKPPRSLAFHKLSSGFLGKEAKNHFVEEFLSFAAISAISGWGIISSVIAMVRLARNY